MIHEAEGLTKLTKKTHRRRLSDEAEIDSVDSPICAYESFIRMREIHRVRLSREDRLGRRLEFGYVWRRLTMTIPRIPNDGKNMSIDDEAKERMRLRS